MQIKHWQYTMNSNPPNKRNHLNTSALCQWTRWRPTKA